MNSRFIARLMIAPLGLLALGVVSALAQSPATPTPNKGDIAWMMVATAFVLMMSVPGLALFYGGLVRSKNMLSVLTQVFAIVCMAGLLWMFVGYSLAFTNGGGLNNFIGGFSKAFLKGVDVNANAATFSNGVVIPELLYMAFQMTFAMITPALIVGAFAERMKFSALIVFVALWSLFVYYPIAHMVWYWAGPDAIGAAAKALAAATDAAAKTAAQGKLDEVMADAGLIFRWGALDFAGGTVVHINAGVAGLVGCLIIGKRIGYGRELMAPHSLTMTLIGAALLWVGWFGFNAGSSLEANGTAVLAFVNTMVATCAAALAWLFVEWAAKGKPSMLGLASGAIAGLVAVTPASGFAGPMGSVFLGLVSGAVCFVFCSKVKNAFGYDDSLDVFGVHCVGGVIGAIGVGILASPALGGAGIVDYTIKPGEGAPGEFAMATQVFNQIKAVLLTLVWSGVVSAVLFKLVDATIGLRVPQEKEREGLDIAEHGERAYSN